MRIRFISHPDLMKKCCQEIKFKKYLFSRFQLYVLGECTYMDTTLLLYALQFLKTSPAETYLLLPVFDLATIASHEDFVRQERVTNP